MPDKMSMDTLKAFMGAGSICFYARFMGFFCPTCARFVSTHARFVPVHACFAPDLCPVYARCLWICFLLFSGHYNEQCKFIEMCDEGQKMIYTFSHRSPHHY